MSTLKTFCAAGVAAALVACQGPSSVTSSSDGVSIGPRDLRGVVTSANSPEGGVWVIAETTDLPTRYAKVVVTDAAGRYVIPDLPQASYTVWVRGYGLVDSAKVQASPGRTLDLNVAVAPSRADAAEYYPAAYWSVSARTCRSRPGT